MRDFTVGRTSGPTPGNEHKGIDCTEEQSENEFVGIVTEEGFVDIVHVLHHPSTVVLERWPETVLGELVLERAEEPNKECTNVLKKLILENTEESALQFVHRLQTLLRV
jgi:hypothetical protein